MTIKIKKYVAKVAEFVEHEDGTITKETREIVIKGRRFSEARVWKQIPCTAKLLEHGYVEASYEVDNAKLEEWCKENGESLNPVEAVTE